VRRGISPACPSSGLRQRNRAVIDVLASPKRDLAATRRFFARALNATRRPTEVTTNRAPAYPRVLDEVVPEAWHVMEQYANNPFEADHGRLKARTRPMRGETAPLRPVAC
jgi:transposase, IS6 family